MRKFIFFWSLLLTGLSIQAQSEIHFSGYVMSQTSGRPLSNVAVHLPADTLDAVTNIDGFFNLIVTRDSFSATLQRAGYETIEMTVFVNNGSQGRKSKIIISNPNKVNATKIIEPDESGLYVIRMLPIFNSEYTHYSPSSLTNQIITDVESDKIIMDRSELDATPFIFSEPDLAKSLQIHPGIDFASDGYSDMTVRGGGLGQNQVLLDGAPVYSIGHFQGYISNFNTSMAEEVVVYKAAFPARFGGRLSSVVDVQSSAGNAEDANVDLAVSPALANFKIGLPMDDNGSSLGVSFRRSYLDLLIFPGEELFFRDFNSKLHLNLNDKNKLTLQYYSLKDRFKFTGTEENDTSQVVELDFSFDIVVKNQTTSAKWQHIFNKKLTSSFTSYYTNYSNGVTLNETDYTAPIGSNAISDYQVRFSAGEVGLNGDFELRQSKKMLLRFGLQNRLHLNNSGSLIDKRYDIDGNLLVDAQYGDTVLQKGVETSVYIENEYQYSSKLAFNVGLRTTLYTYRDFTQFYPEPRLSGRYLLNKTSSIKFSYARMHQFMHLYNTDGAASDNFVAYLPASGNLKPQASDILTVGYYTKPQKRFRFVTEAYYKRLTNQPIFYAADLFDRADMEANSLVGKGQVIGWENSIKYVTDNAMFWASATLSKATRNYDELNRGESFSFDYDRRIVGKLGWIVNLENFVFSVIGVGATGNPFTLPTSKYRDIDGGVVLAYDEINNYRSIYHARVDAKFEWHFEDEVQSLELSIYNLLGTRNVDSIYSERDSSNTNYKYTAYTRESFAFLPFLTYRIKIQ